MRVVYVSTDEGVPTFGTKGSSVHVQAMLSQFLDRGDEVHRVTSRPGSPPPPHLSRVGVHLLPAPEGRRGTEPPAKARVHGFGWRAESVVVNSCRDPRCLARTPPTGA